MCVLEDGPLEFCDVAVAEIPERKIERVYTPC